MSSQRRDSARERCDAELTELRLREKGASAAERAAIVQRKVDLKRMRGIGVYFEPPRATLPGGIALPWPAQGSGGGWWPSLPPLSLPELPHLPITLPTEVDAELFAGTFSFGSAMGLCSGIALKKLGKAAATVTGVIFMSITAAERSGYLSVNWNKVGPESAGKHKTQRHSQNPARRSQCGRHR